MLFCLVHYTAAQGTGDLLVLNVGSVTSKILRYNGVTGAFVDTFITLPANFRPDSFAALLRGSLITGPDGNIYVKGIGPQGGYQILRYNGTTGEFMGMFAMCPAFGAMCAADYSPAMTFGPDGNLYVAQTRSVGPTGRSGSVVRFNGSTGAFIDTFVPPDSGGLKIVRDLTFGPDGNLYLYSSSDILIDVRVLRYNGTTGAFIDTFIVDEDLRLFAFQMVKIAFGPGGNLYVATENGLFIYNGRTGAFIRKLTDFGDSLTTSFVLLFGPDSNIYTIEGGNVLRYNGSTGNRLGTFVPTGSGGLSSPISLAFTGSGSTPQNPDAIFYPQLAVGGGYEVVLLVSNKSDSAWTGMAKPLSEGGTLDYLMTPISLAPRETKKFVLTGGATTVSAGLEIFGNPGFPTSRIAVAYFFNYLENGNLVDSIGVPKGQAAKRFIFPVERSPSVNTGIAIRRRANQGSSSISMGLFDARGVQEQSVVFLIGARFLTELFTLPSEFLGSVVVESQDEFYLVVLRLETTQTGFQLTSVPADPN
jgi:hypothetical protein